MTRSAHVVWRELSSIHNGLPPEHRNPFHVEYTQCFDWVGGNPADGIRALVMLEKCGAIRTGAERGAFIGITLLQPYPYRGMEDLYPEKFAARTPVVTAPPKEEPPTAHDVIYTASFGPGVDDEPATTHDVQATADTDRQPWWRRLWEAINA